MSSRSVLKDKRAPSRRLAQCEVVIHVCGYLAAQFTQVPLLIKALIRWLFIVVVVLCTFLLLFSFRIYFFAALYIKGNDVTKLASMAKLKGGRLSRELGDSCLQFWGGMGFTSEVMVSRFYRWDRWDEQYICIGLSRKVYNILYCHVQFHYFSLCWHHP